MRIMDSLIRALEARSFRVSVRDGDKRSTVVDVDDELIPFRLEERAAREERPPDPRKGGRLYDIFAPRVVYDYFPSGELRLHIGISVSMMTRHSWRDGGKKRVEDWLNSFVVGLIRTSQGMKAERIEAERRRLEAERRRKEWEETERRRRESERLRKEQEEQIRQVEATLDRWIRYRNLDEMVAEVRSRVAYFGREIPPESRLGRWLSVAECWLQQLDPIRSLLSEMQPSEVDAPPPKEG